MKTKDIIFEKLWDRYRQHNIKALRAGAILDKRMAWHEWQEGLKALPTNKARKDFLQDLWDILTGNPDKVLTARRRNFLQSVLGRFGDYMEVLGIGH